MTGTNSRSKRYLSEAGLHSSAPVTGARVLCKLWQVPSLLALTILLIGPPLARTQQVTAAITGKVTDPSGAAVANATVTAIDSDRRTTWPTTTNQDGIYSLPRLPLAAYSVRVESSGFVTAEQSGITLVLNQVARVDFTLQLGNVTTHVEVNALPPILQTQSTELSTLIDAHVTETLPLISRNYVELTLLAPGSTHTDPSQFTNGNITGNFGSGRPNINGNREQQDNFILDGLDNN